ncbi:MAG: hypothetical protein K9N49_00415 [Candidatus Marinimicrobia bacterium]|nr:hypothetical protein [Candidatus Neomarinimicrobiota bacterium]
MNDYFFISSPLHFLIAANVAIQHPQHHEVAVLISKDRTAAARYRAAAEKHPEIFSRVLDLSPAAARGRRGRAAAFRDLRAEFARPMTARLFTGNDRRLEFQYAMHTASRANPQVTGIYLDEGMVTYAGHKSMHRLAHRWLDPLCKKLYYGRWYRPAVTTGASAWIDTVHAAFPAAVHPLLKTKPVQAIDVAPFKSPALRSLASALLEGHPDYPELLGGIKVVYTLPHEGAYRKSPEAYAAIGRRLGQYVRPAAIAIKPHPRMTRPDLPARMFPGSILLDHRLGLEAMLPLLGDDCIVVGDISSTLLTTRWLRPDLTVWALVPEEGTVGGMAALYRRLGIPLVHSGRLGECLAGECPPARPGEWTTEGM